VFSNHDDDVINVVAQKMTTVRKAFACSTDVISADINDPHSDVISADINDPSDPVIFEQVDG
jgi:hypothetical protein